MMTTPVLFVRLPHGEDLQAPARATAAASGVDLRAATSGQVSLAPGQRRLIPTGISLSLPDGLEAQIRPRSGLAYKHGVTVLNSPGTIDSDYRGEIKVLLINHGDEPFLIERGDRIAQMVFAAVVMCPLVEAKTLDATSRGDGGFGHTGIG